MIALVITTLLVVWLVLSALTTVGCAAVVGAGAREDRARGYLADVPPPLPEKVGSRR